MYTFSRMSLHDSLSKHVFNLFLNMAQFFVSLTQFGKSFKNFRTLNCEELQDPELRRHNLQVSCVLHWAFQVSGDDLIVDYMKIDCTPIILQNIVELAFLIYEIIKIQVCIQFYTPRYIMYCWQLMSSSPTVILFVTHF